MKWMGVMGVAFCAALVVNYYQSINFDDSLAKFFQPRSGSDASMDSIATLDTLIATRRSALTTVATANSSTMKF